MASTRSPSFNPGLTGLHDQNDNGQHQDGQHQYGQNIQPLPQPQQHHNPHLPHEGHYQTQSHPDELNGDDRDPYSQDGNHHHDQYQIPPEDEVVIWEDGSDLDQDFHPENRQDGENHTAGEGSRLEELQLKALLMSDVDQDLRPGLRNSLLTQDHPLATSTSESRRGQEVSATTAHQDLFESNAIFPVATSSAVNILEDLPQLSVYSEEVMMDVDQAVIQNLESGSSASPRASRTLLTNIAGQSSLSCGENLTVVGHAGLALDEKKASSIILPGAEVVMADAFTPATAIETRMEDSGTSINVISHVTMPTMATADNQSKDFRVGSSVNAADTTSNDNSDNNARSTADMDNTPINNEPTAPLKTTTTTDSPSTSLPSTPSPFDSQGLIDMVLERRGRARVIFHELNDTLDELHAMTQYFLSEYLIERYDAVDEAVHSGIAEIAAEDQRLAKLEVHMNEFLDTMRRAFSTLDNTFV